MTTTTEAMRLALEALEQVRKRADSANGIGHLYEGDCPDPGQPDARDAGCPACKTIDASDAAITALRAALAAAPQPPAAQPATVKESLTPGAQQGEEVAPTRADLIAALRFYATGEHFILSEPSAWDTVSGEPQNWQCDESGTATVEDGYIAKATLEGRLTAEQIETLEDGETLDDAAQPAAAPQPVAPQDPQTPAEWDAVWAARLCRDIRAEVSNPRNWDYKRWADLLRNAERMLAKFVEQSNAAAPAGVVGGGPVDRSSKASRVNALVNTGPYPGMSEAFDAHMGAPCWTDPEYAPDASTWAAAWKAALHTAPPARQALTDERIAAIVREAARGSAIRRDGSTSHRIARAIERACADAWGVTLVGIGGKGGADHG